MANEENLRPLNKRTKSAQREIQSKGGKASAKNKRKQKSIREALNAVLSGKYEIDGQTVDGYTALAVTAFRAAMEGNVKAFKEIRDTIGEKPSEKLNVEGDDLKKISISFVDKSGKRNGKEQDPKIVGEYTPNPKTEDGS